MKITFLGQAGFLIEKNNKKIVIDPYLSDFVKTVEPLNYRRQPIDSSFLKINPDMVIITHNHLDHFDKMTLNNYFNETAKIITLTPISVWKDIVSMIGCNNILFNVGTSVSYFDLTFYSVKADHSDEKAIGVVVRDGKEWYYFTGDTLYNTYIFNTLPTKTFKAVFLPINGVGNNMNCVDARRFVNCLKVKNVVPCHFGMFDEMTGCELQCDNVVIPKIYEEILLK